MTLDRLTAALSDRYTIERELGAGGMATLMLAGSVSPRPAGPCGIEGERG
jgi:hypothetical protein